MSTYIHRGSFIAPAGEPAFADGRDRCDSALKKIFAAGPTPLPTLMKRDRSDAALNAAMAKKLSRQERLRRSNAAESLEAIKKVHGFGARPHLGDSPGDAPFQSKSVYAVAKARERVVSVSGHRLLSAAELTKAFAQPVRRAPADVDVEIAKPGSVARTVTAGRYDYDFDRRGIVLAKRLSARYAKGLTGPALNDVGTRPPESSNAAWNGATAATGAANDWRDQPMPGLSPTVVGSQTTSTPNTTDRDAAIAAIKKDMSKPKRLGARAPDEDD